MTRKGFGEMGITATVAGPVFNVLVGMGLSLTILLLTYNNPRNEHAILDRRVEFSLRYRTSDAGGAEGNWNNEAVLPLTLVIACMLVTGIILVNTVINHYRPGVKISYMSLILYFGVLVWLVVFCVKFDVAAGDGG